MKRNGMPGRMAAAAFVVAVMAWLFNPYACCADAAMPGMPPGAAPGMVDCPAAEMPDGPSSLGMSGLHSDFGLVAAPAALPAAAGGELPLRLTVAPAEPVSPTIPPQKKPPRV
jgi:hypothetical protein